jgi:hypothetical protein
LPKRITIKRDVFSIYGALDLSLPHGVRKGNKEEERYPYRNRCTEYLLPQSGLYYEVVHARYRDRYTNDLSLACLLKAERRDAIIVSLL